MEGLLTIHTQLSCQL